MKICVQLISAFVLAFSCNAENIKPQGSSENDEEFTSTPPSVQTCIESITKMASPLEPDQKLQTLLTLAQCSDYAYPFGKELNLAKKCLEENENNVKLCSKISSKP